MTTKELKSTNIQDRLRLDNLYQRSACTMLGYMPEELHLYTDELKENGFLKDKFTVYTTKGEDINSYFDLEGDNRFPDNLNIFIIDLDDMENISKFAVTLRFERGYRWLTDVIGNSRPDMEE